jgi:hypothetical protein
MSGMLGTIHDAILLSQILTERNRQRDRWGDAHDRGHTGAEWIALLTERIGKVAAAEMSHGGGPRDYERRLIQLAAVAMAALEHEQRRIGL